MDKVRGSRKARQKLVALGAIVVAALTWNFAGERARAADRKSDSAKSVNAFITEVTDVRRVTVIVNKSRTFSVERPFATIVAGSPDIADVKALGDRTIYVLGKQTGTTNVILFDDAAKQIAILDVQVTIDTSNLQQNIQSSTGTRGIRVSATESQVILTGTAVDAVAAERAMAIATGSAPKGSVVVNAMNVAAPQQVMLEVRFLEADRSAGRALGVNLYGTNANGTQMGNSGLGAAANIQTDRSAPVGVPILGTASTLIGGAAPFGNLLTNIVKLNNGSSVDLLLTAPVASSPNGNFQTVTIEFKKFGVELAFVPTVLSRGVINLRVEPSVSELDFTNAVTIAGTTIPALTRRDARTTVELRDGQSFAIAGLLQTRNQQDIAQLPWIGSVPVLGSLFRSSSYQQKETDLVIVVTPRLVAPAAPGQVLASPLDSRLPANDVDFFLNGQMEVRKRYNDYVNSGGDVKGPYGHIIAPDVRDAAPPAVGADQPVVKTLN